MLRGIIICPDQDLGQRFQQLLGEVGLVHVTRALERYPNNMELSRFLRAHAPHIIFLGVESLPKALEIVQETERQMPGVQIVALGRQADAQILLDLMRVGIREFIALPFDQRRVQETLMRIGDVIEAKPPVVEYTSNVFSFLPSKAGAGTSTIAVNAAIALSRIPNHKVLLSDFDLNSGMVRFMLKIGNAYGVSDAAEHALNMDESLWPPLVTSIDALDVLHAGRLNPDFRIEPTQIRHLLDFMRRHYQALCFDFSGNLEKYSLEIMHESKKIFLVCTPEIPSLHLAREKYLYLKHLELHDRVSVLLNRCQKREVISPSQIEELIGVPVHLTFTNDYQGVHRALTLGKWVEPGSPLGKQFSALARTMAEDRTRNAAQAEPNKRKFLEYLSLVPGRLSTSEQK